MFVLLHLTKNVILISYCIVVNYIIYICMQAITSVVVVVLTLHIMVNHSKYSLLA